MVRTRCSGLPVRNATGGAVEEVSQSGIGQFHGCLGLTEVVGLLVGEAWEQGTLYTGYEVGSRTGIGLEGIRIELQDGTRIGDRIRIE